MGAGPDHKNSSLECLQTLEAAHGTGSVPHCPHMPLTGAYADGCRSRRHQVVSPQVLTTHEAVLKGSMHCHNQRLNILQAQDGTAQHSMAQSVTAQLVCGEHVALQLSSEAACIVTTSDSMSCRADIQRHSKARDATSYWLFVGSHSRALPSCPQRQHASSPPATQCPANQKDVKIRHNRAYDKAHHNMPRAKLHRLVSTTRQQVSLLQHCSTVAMQQSSTAQTYLWCHGASKVNCRQPPVHCCPQLHQQTSSTSIYEVVAAEKLLRTRNEAASCQRQPLLLLLPGVAALLLRGGYDSLTQAPRPQHSCEQQRVTGRHV